MSGFKHQTLQLCLFLETISDRKHVDHLELWRLPAVDHGVAAAGARGLGAAEPALGAREDGALLPVPDSVWTNQRRALRSRDPMPCSHWLPDNLVGQPQLLLHVGDQTLDDELPDEDSDSVQVTRRQLAAHRL